MSIGAITCRDEQRRDVLEESLLGSRERCHAEKRKLDAVAVGVSDLGLCQAGDKM